MTDQDRLANIVERCRAELQPRLSSELVRELARIQVQFQFAGEDRTAAQKEMREALSAVLSLAQDAGGSA